MADLDAFARVIQRLRDAPPGVERDAELDLVESELAMLSDDEQAEVRRLVGP